MIEAIQFAVQVFLLASSLTPRGNDALLATMSRRGPHEVSISTATWQDTTRHRTIRVKFYAPREPGRYPVIIFSHGLGNSRDGYEYLGEQWASWGFVSVHPEHPGAATDVVRRGLLALYRAGWDRSLWKTVPGDIRYVIDQLESDDNLPDAVRGRIDRDRIGVAGHSLGAYTALAIGGLNPFGDPAASPRDPRVRAAVALSMSEDVPRKSYAGVTIPVMHMTGTNDTSLLYGTTVRKRRIPFDSITHEGQYLIVWDGANHSTFSDDARRELPRVREGIEATSTIFWEAYLRDDGRALEWLRNGEIARQLAAIARVEVK